MRVVVSYHIAVRHHSTYPNSWCFRRVQEHAALKTNVSLARLLAPYLTHNDEPYPCEVEGDFAAELVCDPGGS